MLIQRWYVEGLKESFSYFGFWCVCGGGYSADFFDLFFFLQKNRFRKKPKFYSLHIIYL